MSSTATLDAVYRYDLTRRWRPGRYVLFVMLNPSTATADTDDATIRRCRGFAEREDAGGFVVVNLYALRSRDPKVLDTHPDPIGPYNDHHLRLWLGAPDVNLAIAAWGAHRQALRRAAGVIVLAAQLDRPLVCLGKTSSGAPRHPLYVPRHRRFEPYP